jgi:MFS family permease
MLIDNLMSFLPTFYTDKEWTSGPELTESDTALILASFSIAQIMFAPLNTAIKGRIGTKNSILVGLLIVTLTTTGLGAISHLNDTTQFKWCAVALRFWQG